ncbi:hypothetical protein MKX03_015181 [Papaver bracteatum]|nr:hypothetical protein MKX03_015181 [Papaver bracteatum]
MSSKSSILVLGSIAVVFFFTLTLMCVQSVDGFSWGDIFINKKKVWVQNAIDPKITLKLHCWSSEDDFGEHMLYYKQNFTWSFMVNFRQTTKFVCDSSWTGVDGGNHYVRFSAYKAKRDWGHRCADYCFWSLRQDGGYYGDIVDNYPFEKMFSY